MGLSGAVLIGGRDQHVQRRAGIQGVNGDCAPVVLVVNRRFLGVAVNAADLHAEAADDLRDLLSLLRAVHDGGVAQVPSADVRQQHLRCVAPAVGGLLSRQPAEIRLHRVGGFLVAVRQHGHGTLGIRPVRVQIVRAQVAQRQGVPIGQRVVIDDAVVLRPDAARVVFAGNAPRHGFLKARLRVPLIVDDRAILRHCPQHIHIRLQALYALPRHAQCIHITRMIARIHHTVPRIHRADNIGRTRLINVRPAEPVHIVDQCHGDIAPLRHLPVPLRAALRDITSKGIAHRHAHRLPVRVQADGIGVCAAARRIAHLRHPQRVQYRAHGGVVAHVGRPQGEQLLRVQRPHVLVAGLRQQARAAATATMTAAQTAGFL